MDSRPPALAALRARVIRASMENSADAVLADYAAQEAREAAAMVDASHDTRAAWVLGMFHWLRYCALPDGDDLEDYQAAVRFLSPVYDADPEVVPALLRERFEQVRKHQGAPPPDPVELNSRARQLLRRYEQAGELTALSGAVKDFRAALAATPDGDPSLAWRQSNLGAALRMLFSRTGEQADLAEAISLHRDAVTHTDDGLRPQCQSNLAGALLDQYRITGAASPLTEAVALLQEAADGIPADDPERAAILGNLAAARSSQARAEATGESLAEAVERHRQVVAGCPGDSPERSRCLANLGSALEALAERTGNRALLAEAEQAQREAVRACPQHHPDRPGYLSNLGATLTRLSEATADQTQLEEAVGLLRTAVAATPPGDLNRPGYLANLATATFRLGERNGQTSLMTEAVAAHRAALDLLPEGRPERAAQLSNLGLALQAMYERTGQTNLLAEAVAAQRAAVAGAQAGGGVAEHLARLGAASRAGSRAAGNAGELGQPIEAGQAAAARTQSGHPDLAGHLSNLGGALYLMFQRNEQPEVLKEAVQVLRAAVTFSAPEDPDRPGQLSNLGLSLHSLFDENGQPGLLREAAQIHREAVAASPHDHPDRASYLSNLGITLQALSERTGDEGALAEATAAFRDAAACAIAGHPERATYLVNLGNVLQVQHDRVTPAGQAPGPALLAEAAACYAKAACDTRVPALTRVYAYRQVSRLAMRRGTGQDALTAAEAAVALLPQVALRALVRRDLERQIGQLAGLAGDVAAAAVSAGRPGRAAELLEQTRGLLVAETLHARGGDLAKLRSTADGAAPASAFEDRQRRIDGSGSADALAGQGSDGPVVFMYTSPAHCGALALTANPARRVRAIPLPDLRESEAYRQANRLRDALTGEASEAETSSPQRQLRAEREILDVLAWLWDTVTEPILTDVGYDATPAPGQDWPRVWWCPAGILAYLPIHAAGRHTDGLADDPALRRNPRSVLDRVVSSYIPTVRSLAYARAHRPATAGGPPLIVAVPHAPDTLPLPGAAAEAEALVKLMPTAHWLAEPTRGAVLDALPRHPVVHFACHGYADLIDPGASELAMPDRETEPLTLEDINALEMNQGLAYLSACDTMFARPSLADEAVHLAGAFHLAGYQHVIATLWSVTDTAARHLAVDVYARLSRNGIAELQTDLSAHALHHATRKLRARRLTTPSLWASHTHTGS